MPISEERYTAWVDGKMSELEQTAFERELASEDLPGCLADREEAHRLGHLLRRYAPATPESAAGDFFAMQVAQRIEAVAATERPAVASFRWSLPHLAWAAGVCLLLTFTFFYRSTPAAKPAAAPLALASAAISAPTAGEEAPSILDSHSEDPSIYVTPVRSEKEGLTVVWLDGLDYLPASYQLQ